MEYFYSCMSPKHSEKSLHRVKRFLREWSYADWIQLGILVVGVAYCIITYGLWDLSRQAIHSGQRAYLVFHAPTLNEPLAVGGTPQVSLDLVNSGQTPAQNVRYSLALQVLPSYPLNITWGPLNMAGGMGASQTIKLKAELAPLKQADFDDITADPFIVGATGFPTVVNRPKLYIYGVVQYDDVFSGHGQSEFCAVYWSSKNAFPGCPVHNDIK